MLDVSRGSDARRLFVGFGLLLLGEMFHRLILHPPPLASGHVFHCAECHLAIAEPAPEALFLAGAVGFHDQLAKTVVLVIFPFAYVLLSARVSDLFSVARLLSFIPVSHVLISADTLESAATMRPSTAELAHVSVAVTVYCLTSPVRHIIPKDTELP